MAVAEGTPRSTNWEKFQTRNPVVRRLIDRFFGEVGETVAPLAAASVLDAGCGEGEALARLATILPPRPAAVDIDPVAVAATRERFPALEVSQASLYDLPFEDGSFDLVLCLEVLEHLRDPAAGLAELARVSRDHVVVSVPHEPWFRLGSAMRGKYVRTLGNHPEHLNHWGPRSFRDFLERELRVVRVKRPAPWLVAHCRRR
jgi:SAM-dependent methyltransferase